MHLLVNLRDSDFGRNYMYVRNNYSEQLLYYSNTAFNSLREEERVLVKEFFPNKKDYLLDVGIGCGRTTLGLFANGYNNIIGIDMVPEFIEWANKKLKPSLGKNIKLMVSNMEDFSSDIEFGGILFSEGFSTIPTNESRLKVLFNMRKHLKKGGHLIFSIYDRNLEDYQSNPKWMDQGLYCEDDKICFDSGYMHFAKDGETEDLIKEAGLTLVKTIRQSGFVKPNRNGSNMGRYYVARK